MKIRRLFAGMAAAALAAAMMAAPVSAATSTPGTGFDYTAAHGNTHDFTKYLVMDSANACPAVTFGYEIRSGAAASADDTGNTIEVYAGVGSPTITNANFTAGQETTAGATDDGITGTNGGGSDAEKYAQSTFTVDFSNVDFTEPGIYRYIITEKTNEFPTGFTALNTNTSRTLDVFVEDNGSKTLSVTQYILYDSIIEAPFTKNSGTTIDNEKDGNRVTDNAKKTDGFVNKYSTNSLTFSKAVTGNQASRDKYFKFTVTVSNAQGAVLNVIGAGETFEAAPTKTDATKYSTDVMASNTVTDEVAGFTGTQVIVPNGGTYTHDFYLQDGQSVQISGIPAGAGYSITEANEDYKPSLAITGDTQTCDTANDSGSAIETGDDKNTYTDTYLKSDTTAAFTNDRTGTVPTGVILSIAAPCVIGVAVISGLVIMNIKKKKDESEE